MEVGWGRAGGGTECCEMLPSLRDRAWRSAAAATCTRPGKAPARTGRVTSGPHPLLSSGPWEVARARRTAEDVARGRRESCAWSFHTHAHVDSVGCFLKGAKLGWLLTAVFATVKGSAPEGWLLSQLNDQHTLTDTAHLCYKSHAQPAVTL